MCAGTGMVREAEDLLKQGDNVVIKAPLTPEGIKATKSLADQGVKVNVTLCFSANQALLAAKAGAAYISPFIGRLDDIGVTGMQLIGEIADLLFHSLVAMQACGIETEEVAADGSVNLGRVSRAETENEAEEATPTE